MWILGSSHDNACSTTMSASRPLHVPDSSSSSSNSPSPAHTQKLRRTRPLTTYNFSPARSLASSPGAATTTTSPPNVSITPSPSFQEKDQGTTEFNTHVREDPKSRSKSPGDENLIGEGATAAWSSWWGNSFGPDRSPRPWKDSPKRKQTVPPEHTEAWAHTREVRPAPSHIRE